MTHQSMLLNLRSVPFFVISETSLQWESTKRSLSGRGLVTPIFFSCSLFFFRGHLSQISGFHSARQILVVSLATQARACISNDHNIFYTPRGGRTMVESNSPGAFLINTVLLKWKAYFWNRIFSMEWKLCPVPSFHRQCNAAEKSYKKVARYSIYGKMRQNMGPLCRQKDIMYHRSVIIYLTSRWFY